MKKSLLLSCIAALSLGASAFSVDDYQVTGSVSEVSDTKIVVMKGKEKFEIARTADAKVTGDLKVGAKVTVHYTMSAKSVEVKAAK
jgi:hypothetical protein